MTAPGNDHDLLRRYVQQGSEDAFAELVARYAELVYGAALRQVGRSDLAEDVAQATFILLAKKASGLSQEMVLGAWLHKVTRYAAMNALRIEARRRRHERRAAEMIAAEQAKAMASHTLAGGSVAWGDGLRLLDEGIARLNQRDREAIVLRYLQRGSLAEVAAALGISSDAAQMRVSRAVEKLRDFYRRRGLNLNAAHLGAAVGVAVPIALPAQFSASLSAGALRSAASGGAAAKIAASASRSMALARARTSGSVAAVGAGALGIVLLGVVELASVTMTASPSSWLPGIAPPPSQAAQPDPPAATAAPVAAASPR